MADKIDPKKEIASCWNGNAESYDSRYGHGLKSTAEEIAWKEMLRKLTGETPLDILDVGTGTGFLAILLAELGHKVTGIDLSEGMMVKGKEKATAKNLQIQFLLGDAENLPKEFAGKFDMVINRHLLWTLLEPEKSLAEWNRVLKPGGRVAIIDGNWAEQSSSAKVRKFLGRVVIMLTEFTNPWKQKRGYSDELQQMLPMRQGDNRNKTVDILKSCGYDEIEVTYLTEIDRVESKSMPLGQRLANYYRRHMIVGRKRASD